MAKTLDPNQPTANSQTVKYISIIIYPQFIMKIERNKIKYRNSSSSSFFKSAKWNYISRMDNQNAGVPWVNSIWLETLNNFNRIRYFLSLNVLFLIFEQLVPNLSYFSLFNRLLFLNIHSTILLKILNI